MSLGPRENQWIATTTAAAGNAVTIKPGNGGSPNTPGAPWNTDLSPAVTIGQTTHDYRWRILKVAGSYNPVNTAGTLTITDDNGNLLWQADGVTFDVDAATLRGMQVPRNRNATTPGTFTVALSAIAGVVGKLNVIFFLEQ